MRPITLLKVEGFGALAHSPARWLSGLSDHLRRALPSLSLRATSWNRISPDHLDVDVVLGHSYGIAGAVRALARSPRTLPLLLALDPVPRWAWCQFPGWRLPPNVRTCLTWYQRNLSPLGEPFALAPNSSQHLLQFDLSSRGLLHTTLPTHPEVAAHLTALLTAFANAPTTPSLTREFSHKD